MDRIVTPAELEANLGANVRTLRLKKNLSRDELAAAAGVSLTAIKNLETGAGSTTKTLVSVVRALGKEDWIASLSPQISINPLHMVRDKPARQRASRKRL